MTFGVSAHVGSSHRATVKIVTRCTLALFNAAAADCACPPEVHVSSRSSTCCAWLAPTEMFAGRKPR